MARRPATIILSVVFGILAFSAWLLVSFVVFNRSSSAPMLTWEICIAIEATMAAWGGWRGRKWASGAAVAFGLATAGVLVSLPSIFLLSAKLQSRVWIGAAAVLVFAVLGAMYFRFDTRQQSGTPLHQASS